MKDWTRIFKNSGMQMDQPALKATELRSFSGGTNIWQVSSGPKQELWDNFRHRKDFVAVLFPWQRFHYAHAFTQQGQSISTILLFFSKESVTPADIQIQLMSN